MGREQVSRLKNSRKGIEDAFKSFMARYFNKGPRLAKVYIMDDCVVVYCKDFLTPLEKNLADDKYGEYLIKASRQRVIENNEADFLNIARQNYKEDIDKFYIDFNIDDDSLCCVFI